MWRFRVFAASWLVLLAYWIALGAALVTAGSAPAERGSASAAARSRRDQLHVEGICVRRSRGGLDRADRAPDIQHGSPGGLRGRRFRRTRGGACRFPLCACGAYRSERSCCRCSRPMPRRSKSAARCSWSAWAFPCCWRQSRTAEAAVAPRPAASSLAADLPAHDRESDDARGVCRDRAPAARSRARSRMRRCMRFALAAGSASVRFADRRRPGRRSAGTCRTRAGVARSAQPPLPEFSCSGSTGSSRRSRPRRSPSLRRRASRRHCRAAGVPAARSAGH